MAKQQSEQQQQQQQQQQRQPEQPRPAAKVLAAPRPREAIGIHSKVVGLEQHCARLKQQKRVAEKFASAAQAEAEAAKQQATAAQAEAQAAKQQQRAAKREASAAQVEAQAAKQQASAAQAEAQAAKRQRGALEARLLDSERRAKHYEQLSEQRLGEVYHLRRKFDVSFQARVEQDVFRAVEATGEADVFPHGLTPTLAAVQSKVGGAALQRRAARLADPGRHPLGLHPGVHEWASFGQLRPEPADFMLDI